MSRTIYRKTLNTVLVVTLILIAGCATTPKGSLDVTVSEQGQITVRGKRVALDNVGRAVKRAGAKSGTMIKVSVPADASSGLRMSIRRNISKAGCPNIFFVRGQRSAAYVNKENEKGGLKKPKPTIPKIRKR